MFSHYSWLHLRSYYSFLLFCLLLSFSYSLFITYLINPMTSMMVNNCLDKWIHLSTLLIHESIESNHFILFYSFVSSLSFIHSSHTYLNSLGIVNEVREERANEPIDNWLMSEWDETRKEVREGREWSSNDKEDSLLTTKMKDEANEANEIKWDKMRYHNKHSAIWENRFLLSFI